MTTPTTIESPAPPVIDSILFARGMAVIRIFFGLIVLANGLAKLEPSLARIDIGPYHANLITRDGARGILNFEINERQIRKDAPKGTQVPGLKSFVNDVVLANWGVVQWVVVLVELALVCSWSSASRRAERPWSILASSSFWPSSTSRATVGCLSSLTSTFL